MARMLPGEAELVSELTGLSGRAKSVKRFERFIGLDTALSKNYTFSLFPEYMGLRCSKKISASLLILHRPALLANTDSGNK